MNILPQKDDDSSAQLSQGRVLTITVIAMGIVYLLWNISALDFVMVPLRLFVTYIHEAGHSLMAVITGGRVIGFSVYSDGSGIATTAGGSRALILPAGYLGAAFFGAALFYATNAFKRPRTVSMVVGIGLIIITVMYANIGLDDSPWALVIGIVFGAGLIGMGWKLSRDINLLLLNVLAVVTGLNALLDVWILAQNSDITAGNGRIRNDALAFSEDIAPILPASVWAIIWAILALAMLAAAVYYSLLRPILNDAAQSKEQDV